MKRILLVKTSSLGDLVQTFDVLSYLHERHSPVEIDWVVEKKFLSLIESHPLVHRAIPFERSRILTPSFLSLLRSSFYDAIFDLQGNCKSALLTLLSRGTVKIGFGKKSVREWPNLFATQIHFDPPKSLNIRLQYLYLIQHYFCDETPPPKQIFRLRISSDEQAQIHNLLLVTHNPRIMVCLGSRWPNKQIDSSTARSFLCALSQRFGCSFLLIWGSPQEREACLTLQKDLPHSVVVDKLSLPCWQNLMAEVDLVFTVDSAALHLCGTTSTPSFSVFGPTSAKIFAPIDSLTVQGACPYHQTFEKQCPYLRSCSTGACTKQISLEVLIQALDSWKPKNQHTTESNRSKSIDRSTS